MTREALIELVQARIDELSPFSATDTVELNPSNDLVDKLLDEAAKYILLVFPLYMMPTDDIPITSITPNKTAAGASVTGVGYIPLPTDFLRLHSFKMTDWKRVVNHAISQDSPTYKLQANPVTRGGVAKPVCAVVIDYDQGAKVLEYYSVTNHTVQQRKYVPLKLPDATAGTFPDGLAEACAWQCAILVFQTMGNIEGLKMAAARLEQLRESL